LPAPEEVATLDWRTAGAATISTVSPCWLKRTSCGLMTSYPSFRVCQQAHQSPGRSVRRVSSPTSSSLVIRAEAPLGSRTDGQGIPEHTPRGSIPWTRAGGPARQAVGVLGGLALASVGCWIDAHLQ
jgi:hypothetical protein